MKCSSLFSAFAAPLALGAGLALSGCSDPMGEVVVVLTTDMSIPKDIDAIQVEVEVDGRVQFYSEYDERQGGLRLPGTLGIVDDRPERRFTVRVIGLKEGRPRILRAITTETVDGGTRMLRAPLRWLCDGSATEGDDGRVEFTKCPPGEVCFADTCAPSTIVGSSLPEFSAAEVFGGGTGQGNDGLCFNTIACFDGALPVKPEKVGADCTVEAEGATNVALRTESDGLCGATGCFVPLDEGDSEGFTEVEGSSPRRLRIPSIVCEMEGRVLGVALSAHCAPKTPALPVCGPWSVAGNNAAPKSSDAVTLAAGQHHPTSLALAGGHVFWTNAGEQGKENGSVKRVPTSGGTPVRIAADQAFPSALALESAGSDPAYAYWINEDTGAISYASSGGGDFEVLFAAAGARNGLAVAHNEIFWATEGGQIWSATTAGTEDALIAQDQDEPTRIAVDDTGVYWTNRGEGAVRRAAKGADSLSTSPLAWGQDRPIALAVSDTHVYWLNQGTLKNGYEDGAVMRVVRTGTSVETGDEPEVIAASKKLPYAIAIDDEHVYWTNLLDGTVMRAPITGGETPKVLADGQSNPIAITVDQETVYWANAGTSAGGYKDGAVMRVKK
ncbi:MAG TPA: hypothetical protein VE093_40425 [Polyangiaceae bacterium]|nr:hypothetical protein [Polyangiaceae bacterium]